MDARPTPLRGSFSKYPTDPTHLQAQAMDKKAPYERRSGQDRRQKENGPPDKHERRRTIEPRQPEVRELHLSPEELQAMGFGQATPEPPHPKKTA